MTNIGSFTFQFDQSEDRIRLIGNMSNGQPRVDFWLTRRLCLRILGASDQLVRQTSKQVSRSAPEHREAVAQFEHEQAREALKVQEAPLQTCAPAAVLHRLDASFRGGRYQLSFFTGESEEAVAVSVLNYAELHQVLHLLHRGSQALDWGAPEQLFDTQVPASQTLQ
uniref:hypothetical protein n=1 Tax=Marinobacterium profundum TaxID=1714300 RepID=UPI0008375294|nr:hypothetical protein [Marinobacterium profundum]